MKNNVCPILSLVFMCTIHSKEPIHTFENSEKKINQGKEFTTSLVENSQKVGFITYSVSNKTCSCSKKNSDIPGECGSKCPCRGKHGQCLCALPHGKVITLNVTNHNRNSKKLLLHHAQEKMLHNGCTQETIELL